jgi:2-polyprenyl-3-methyl-5-hydroxy-6-metoxy-1,4-benzoquinol methylase
MMQELKEKPVLEVQEFLHKALAGRTELKMLEAGCGSASWVTFEQKAYVVGLDISDKQLQRHPGLDERVQGDLQTYDFPPETFDIIACWNVLEHLPEPEKALDRFASAIKKDGLIILGLPNLMSFKGLLTKYLPYELHVWVYKYLRGVKDAGKDDTGPFKTFLKPAIAPNAVKQFAAQKDLDVVYFDIYDVLDTFYFPKENRMSVLTSAVYGVIQKALEVLTLGQLGGSEFIIVMQKKSADIASPIPESAAAY